MNVTRDTKTGALNFYNTREDLEKIALSKRITKLENRICELERKVNILLGDKQNG